MRNWREQLAPLVAQLAPVLARLRVFAVPVVAGFFLIVYAAIGLLYYQERQSQASLVTRAQTLDRLLLLASRQAPVAGLQAQAEAATAAIPASLLPDQMTAVIFPVMRRLTAGAGVAIQAQKSSLPRSTRVGSRDYQAYPFNVTLQGNYVTLLNFVGNLESQQDLPTLIVRKASIAASGDASSASIDYEILAQPKKAS
jgi:hypothetical protein